MVLAPHQRGGHEFAGAAGGGVMYSERGYLLSDYVITMDSSGQDSEVDLIELRCVACAATPASRAQLVDAWDYAVSLGLIIESAERHEQSAHPQRRSAGRRAS